MKEERALFAERLRAAAHEAGCDGAVALMTKFNSRYGGTSVSSQAVSQWLGGKVMPKQDKVRALADVLGVDLHWLQSGEGKAGTLRQRPPAWPEPVSDEERRAIEAFLKLPEGSRRLVGELIAALANSGQRGAAKR